MPIFGKKTKNGNLSCSFSHVDGLKGFAPNIAIQMEQDDADECIKVKPRIGKMDAIRIPYADITAVTILTDKEIAEQSKSVVGRAVVGGILLGPLGAIVGGMSGIGNKQKTVSKYYFIINYTDCSGDIKVASFEIVGASLHWSNFHDTLKNKIGEPAKH